MAGQRLSALEHLKEQLQKFPGIGARSAERMAFHVLRSSRDAADELAAAIIAVKNNIIHCNTCYNLTESDPCPICANDERNHHEIWVVEQPKDVTALEATGLVRGVYHVLMGHISPLEGVEPGDLTIDALVKRVKSGSVSELVIATNPTLDGDGTALYLQSVLADAGVRLTRPARGLAVGSPLEYASKAMLEAAIRGRAQF